MTSQSCSRSAWHSTKKDVTCEECGHNPVQQPPRPDPEHVIYQDESRP